MTIGHLVECVFAKLCCLDGYRGDGTVFLPFNEEKIYETLQEKGFNAYGNEILYNGFTGKQLDCEIFIGPTYYFRLKHMVAEKMHSRSTGPKVSLTRQPTAGRRKGGGLRIGEMERDSVLSHGISQFMQESMMERSDKYEWVVCKKCGTLATFNENGNNKILHCNLCNNDTLVKIQTPYSFKLLVQELEAMNIQMRINTEKVNFPILDYEDLEDNSDIDDIDDNNENNNITFLDLKKGGNNNESEDESDGENQDDDVDVESDEIDNESDDDMDEDGGDDENDSENDDEDDSESDNIEENNTDSEEENESDSNESDSNDENESYSNDENESDSNDENESHNDEIKQIIIE